MINLNRILVPTDLSEYAGWALPYAEELAASFGATLYLLHVVEPYWLEPISTAEFPGKSSTKLHLPWEPNEGRLQEIKNDIERVEVKIAEVQGIPFVEIVSFARKEDIDLIVLATHGRSGISHALIGSVAEKVMQMAPCPVMTIKDPDHKFALP